MTDFIRVDDYETREDDLVQVDGKLIRVKFAEVFGRDELLDFENFIIKKSSVVKLSEQTVKYINYFLRYYDEDKELISIYFNVKYYINKLADADSVGVNIAAFRSYLYKTLACDSMYKKVRAMVEDNYMMDVESHEGAQRCDDVSKFTNEQCKVIYVISTFLKLMIPLSFHFINILRLDPIATLKVFNVPLLQIFSSDEIDLNTKIWAWLKKKTDTLVKAHGKIYKQLVVYEKDPYVRTREILNKDIMIDNMYKFIFKENAIIFMNVIVRKQLSYARKEKWDHNLNEVTGDSDNGSATYVDMLLRNLTRDETVSVISEANIEREIARLRRKMPFVTDDEIDYYYDNHANSELQEKIVNYFYAREFGGLFELELLTRRQYITIMVLLKRRLLIENYLYLPQIISGNKMGRTNNRIIQNNKYVSKLNNSETYKVIREENYSLLQEMESIIASEKEKDINSIIGLMSTLINTKFTIVDYEVQDKKDEPIDINSDIFSNEMLDYISLF